MAILKNITFWASQQTFGPSCFVRALRSATLNCTMNVLKYLVEYYSKYLVMYYVIYLPKYIVNIYHSLSGMIRLINSYGVSRQIVSTWLTWSLYPVTKQKKCTTLLSGMPERGTTAPPPYLVDQLLNPIPTYSAYPLLCTDTPNIFHLPASLYISKYLRTYLGKEKICVISWANQCY